MKAKHIRLLTLLSIVSIFSVGAGILLYTFKNYVSFYQTPSQILQGLDDSKLSQKFRMGAYVKPGSIKIRKNSKISFIAHDAFKEITVIYEGHLPQLFRDGQGVVIDGSFRKGRFYAQRVLAKHDEVYTAKNRTLRGSPS